MSNIAEKVQLLFDVGEFEVKPPKPVVPIPKMEIVTSVPYIEVDIGNIRQMLPKLYDHQQQDVLKIEKRFQVGKGYLCTNGTGTGKTFVGLGTVKRFWAKGCRNILIVTPTETKCGDWIDEGKHVNLKLYKLEGVNDKGHNIRVTTYANYYQNDELDTVIWDLVVYDESHYLNQNSKGNETAYLTKHKFITNLPSSVKNRAGDIVGDKPKYELGNDYELYQWQLDAWRNQMRTYIFDTVGKTKVLFLSATPFAYHKSIKYADGCLFDITECIEEQENPRSGYYNEPSPWEKFMMEHFGYRMKHNKLTIPETGVDQNLLERAFFENHVQKGVMSTKILELDYDYSRDFFLVDSELGHFINSGIEMWWNKDVYEKYPLMAKVVPKKYRYLYINQLLEAIKAKEILDRIQQHLDLGRKVVIFHSYNHATVEHPFRFNEDKLTTADEEWWRSDLRDEIQKWYQQFPQYANLSLKGLNNCRATIRERFPDALEFNGTISKKKKKQNIELFNDDNSGYDIIIVQSKAGREGISLHDNKGGKPRVLINQSLPVAPTEAIQTEGRIYRSGLQSNAMFEYPVIHTSFEMVAFATTIASRAKTAENLAMGNYARDLETAFKEGYMNATIEAPSLEQGVGGKESDRKLLEISEFDKAKTYYWSRAKKNSKNKAAEGVDYFATPEPLGMKMVEWLDPQPDEHGLEPSVGHGAIGRWFPGFSNNVFVEPSLKLFGEMAINCTGRHENVTFEEFKIINKADFIAMNPPFGHQGRTAIEHIQKALIHMNQRSMKGARLLAIIPNGPAMEKKLDILMEHKIFNSFRYTGEILLPEVTFKRAGTGVMCRIIKIEHVNTGNEQFRRIDLSRCSTIEEFFDEIEHLNF